MTLLDLINNLAKLDTDFTIYAKNPWQAASEAVAALPDPDERPVPPELEIQGFRYFPGGQRCDGVCERLALNEAAAAVFKSALRQIDSIRHQRCVTASGAVSCC